MLCSLPSALHREAIGSRVMLVNAPLRPVKYRVKSPESKAVIHCFWRHFSRHVYTEATTKMLQNCAYEYMRIPSDMSRKNVQNYSEMANVRHFTINRMGIFFSGDSCPSNSVRYHIYTYIYIYI